MIVYEVIEGTDLVRAYSNTGMKIRQDNTGTIYGEAIDPVYMNRTYTETEELIEEELEPEEILEIILGGDQR